MMPCHIKLLENNPYYTEAPLLFRLRKLIKTWGAYKGSDCRLLHEPQRPCSAVQSPHYQWIEQRTFRWLVDYVIEITNHVTLGL